PEIGNCLLRFGAVRAAASGEHEMTRPMVGKPARCRQAKAAAASRDEMSFVWRRPELPARHNRDLAGLGGRYDDFADVAGLLHQPDRIYELKCLETAVGQRREFALGNAFEHFPE